MWWFPAAGGEIFPTSNEMRNRIPVCISSFQRILRNEPQNLNRKSAVMMGLLARVIVEQRDDQWTAYFGDEPQTTASASQPIQAMQRLLRTVGNGEFHESGLQQIDEATRDGHLEYLIPFLSHLCDKTSRRSGESGLERSQSFSNP
jgi:hypothetical protein